MKLNSYLYAEPTVVEWLSQAEEQSCMEFQKRAAERIAAFERAFGGTIGRTLTGEACSRRNGTGQRVTSVEIEVHACIIWSRRNFWI